MSLKARMNELIRAGFSGIWISSHEHQDAIAELAAMVRDESWQLACWNIEQGLHGTGSTMAAEASDPLSAVRAATASMDGGASILVLENFHRFLGSPEIVQAIHHAVIEGKTNRSFIVILSPTVHLPAELEKLFVTVEHELPTLDQLLEIARGIATESGELPEGRELDDVLDAASGLTRYEAEGAYSLSRVRHGKLTPGTICEPKTQRLKKTCLLSLLRGGNDLDRLCSLSVSGVCLVCTANDVQELPPELVRAERFEAVASLNLLDRKLTGSSRSPRLNRTGLDVSANRPAAGLRTAAGSRDCARSSHEAKRRRLTRRQLRRKRSLLSKPPGNGCIRYRAGKHG